MTANDETNRQQVRRLLNTVILESVRITELSTSELDLALRLTRRVRLLGRLGENLVSAGLLESLQPTAADQLRGSMAMADARSRLALWELDRIASAMRSVRSTPLVAMKGCTYILLNLPNARGRIFADVDLMTSEEDLEDVEDKLNARGWASSELTPYDQNYYRKWTHELPPLIHEEREVEVDLHHNIMPRTARLNPSSQKLLERSCQLANSRYSVFADEDIVLHTMVHLMYDSDLADKLRDLVDIRDLLEHFSGRHSSFWQILVDRAEELDLTRPAYYSIRYVHSLFGLPIPDHVVQHSQKWSPPGIVRWFMDRAMPRALYPQHPDYPSKVTDLYRLLLYMRSHWIRMPPWLLIYHLSYKFIRTRIRRKEN